jgi:hypothetical protein
MRARPLVYFLVAAAALGGCSKPDLAPIPAASAASPEARRSLPPVTHKWSTTAVTCPDLTGAAADRLKLGGQGTQTHATGGSVDCRWGPDDFSATSMTVKLTVAGNQAGADAGWQFTSTTLVHPQPLPGVGEEAFVSDPLDGRGIQIDVRTGNASAAIHLIPATGAADGKAEVREAAPEIAATVIAGLVPA